MSRSRSSFDLSGAIATATSLSVVAPEEQPSAQYRRVPLVSFGPTASGPPTQLPPALDDGDGEPSLDPEAVAAALPSPSRLPPKPRSPRGLPSMGAPPPNPRSGACRRSLPPPTRTRPAPPTRRAGRPSSPI